MNLNETAEVLDHVANLDPRITPTVDMARAWHRILTPVQLPAALAAVDAHYARSGNRILVADIVRATRPRSREQWLA